MTETKTILIAGYYGFGNVGDEAILGAMLAALRERRPDLEFIVVSDNPTETATNYDVQSIHWKDVDALLNAARESDLILLGGGGLFQDYWGVPEGTSLTPSHWGISYYSGIGMLAILYQKPFMLYAVGVGPLRTEAGRELTRWTFEIASVAAVRDPESRDLLIELGVPKRKIILVPDPALAVEPESKPAAEILESHGIDLSARPLIGVCIRNWGEGEKADRWKRELAAALDRFLAAQDAQALFIPFQVQEHMLENDRAVAEELVSLMQNQDRASVLPDSHSPAVTAGLVSQCQLTVGMRLHSLVFAASAGIPAIALVYDPKVGSFMNSLGLSEYSLDLSSLTPEQMSGVLESAWARREAIGQDLAVSAGKLRTLTTKAPNLALKLLDQRSKAPFSMEVLQALAIQQTRNLADRERELQSLLAQLEAKQQEVLELQGQIDEMVSSRYWKLAQGIRRLRMSLIPEASRRERFFEGGIQHATELIHTLTRSASSFRESIRERGLLSGTLAGLWGLGRDVRGRRTNRAGEADLALVKSSGLFDEAWYLANNPDVARSKVDPLRHYVDKGGLEGRDPGPQFSSLWYLHRYDDVRRAGMNPLLHYLKYGQQEGRVTSSVQQALTSQVLEPYQADSDSSSYEIVRNVVWALNERSLKGMFVVTSPFVFDEFFNQRVINFSKFLSKDGWGIVYVAWRWSEQEAIPSIGEEVYRNIFQIPVDMFLRNTQAFAQVQTEQNYFVVEFPYPGFFLGGLKLRRHGFTLVYEIIDEWEEFHKVGQALWFNKELESAFVINANVVTAVSQPLIEKFSPLRQGIHLSPNGYTPAFLGEEHRNIAAKNQVQKDAVHLGYFGHLTESWFDWDFLLKVLQLARKKGLNLFVHLIGYGEPDLQKKLARYSDRVKFYGKVHPSELYKYVQNWDAAMIWFRSGKLSEAVDPIKIYEYLYFGLPTIVKGIDHLKDFPLTYVVSNEVQAVETLIAVRQNRLNGRRNHQEITSAVEDRLASSTWEHRFADLLTLLNDGKRMGL